MLTVVLPGVQTFNPFLSDDAESQVVSCAQDWQELCVWQDKLQRCLKCCPGQLLGEADARFDTTTSQLLAELRNVRSWARAEYPRWLAFEVRREQDAVCICTSDVLATSAKSALMASEIDSVCRGVSERNTCMKVLEQLEIRERQYSVAAALLANLRKSGDGGAEAHTGAIIQLNMGEGKTRMILPMLVLALAGLQPGSKQQVVRLNFLDALLRDATGYLHNALTGACVILRRWRCAGPLVSVAHIMFVKKVVAGWPATCIAQNAADVEDTRVRDSLQGCLRSRRQPSERAPLRNAVQPRREAGHLRRAVHAPCCCALSPRRRLLLRGTRAPAVLTAEAPGALCQ